ncbi:hypothetical protein BG011_005891 [Mortierella polycephala]|uniref:Uncharacterized protein n=1 Tax=Mortierella polycephala TaxID=41804 RepID=A0A9P6U0R3_9FUNG|nr:hypothetical protein BG011_005891 [Mortierella polycephala]
MSGYPSEKGFQNELPPQHPFSNPAQEGQGQAGAPYMYAPPPPINTGGQTAVAGAGPGAGAPGGNYYGYTGPTGPAPAALGYPGAGSGAPTQFLDPTVPRPNDILPLHPAIIQRRQIATTLPPCPQGGYHELRTRQ